MSRILRVILWGALAIRPLGEAAQAQREAAAVCDHQGRRHR